MTQNAGASERYWEQLVGGVRAAAEYSAPRATSTASTPKATGPARLADLSVGGRSSLRHNGRTRHQ